MLGLRTSLDQISIELIRQQLNKDEASLAIEVKTRFVDHLYDRLHRSRTGPSLAEAKNESDETASHEDAAGKEKGGEGTDPTARQKGAWMPEDIDALVEAVSKHGVGKWPKIHALCSGKTIFAELTPKQYGKKWSKLAKMAKDPEKANRMPNELRKSIQKALDNIASGKDSDRSQNEFARGANFVPIGSGQRERKATKYAEKADPGAAAGPDKMSRNEKVLSHEPSNFEIPAAKRSRESFRPSDPRLAQSVQMGGGGPRPMRPYVPPVAGHSAPPSFHQGAPQIHPPAALGSSDISYLPSSRGGQLAERPLPSRHGQVGRDAGHPGSQGAMIEHDLLNGWLPGNPEFPPGKGNYPMLVEMPTLTKKRFALSPAMVKALLPNARQGEFQLVHAATKDKRWQCRFENLGIKQFDGPMYFKEIEGFMVSMQLREGDVVVFSRGDGTTFLRVSVQRKGLPATQKFMAALGR